MGHYSCSLSKISLCLTTGIVLMVWTWQLSLTAEAKAALGQTECMKWRQIRLNLSGRAEKKGLMVRVN